MATICNTDVANSSKVPSLSDKLFPCDGFYNCETLLCNFILDCIQKVQNSINLQTKYPNAMSKFLFIQQQQPQFHSTSVHGVFLFLPKFCKAIVQISSPPSCLKAGQIFVKASKLSYFTICRQSCLKNYVHQENLISFIRVYRISMIDTCGYHTFWCFQVRM